MNFYEQIFSRGRATGEGMTHFERLFAAKFGGSPPPEVREYTGIVPVTIMADGTPLLDYLITGNTFQNGTPTPDNPVMPNGTGERTGNLLSEKYENRSINGVGAFTIDSTYDLWIGEVVAGQTYAISNMDYVYGFFTAKPMSNTGATYNGSRGYEISGTAVVTVPSGCTWIAVRVLHNADNAMLNLGSTALPYEPYGIKIPISSNSTTTPVYLGEVQTTRKIKKYVCTGDESWSVTSGQGKTRAVANFTTSIGIVPLSKVVSTHYTGVEGGAGYPDINTITVNNNGTIIIGISSEFIDSNAWKSYLAAQYANGTPVTVWYVLANEETAVVNEPLMRIGDYADTLSKAQAGVTIPTNNGSTTVDVDTTVKPSEVYLKYMG